MKPKPVLEPGLGTGPVLVVVLGPWLAVLPTIALIWKRTWSLLLPAGVNPGSSATRSSNHGGVLK